jgi:hypothetical protein
MTDSDSTRERVHRIVLRKNQGSWEITDDTLVNANDAPPTVVDKPALMEAIREEAEIRRAAEHQILSYAGVTPTFLAEERERLAKEGFDARQIEDRLSVIVNEKARAAAQPLGVASSKQGVGLAMNANRAYNRTAAKAYIDKWWYRRNPAWGTFDDLGGDCTNWMSQIINAGGVPEDKTGGYQWYWDNMQAPRSSPPYTRSASWAGVNELWNYIQGNSSNNGPNGQQGRL